jgi:biotin synthase
MELNDRLYKSELNKDDLIHFLALNEKDDTEALRARAYEVMKENIGESVFLRGLIEFSNICINDCYYCGIRKGNKKLKKYTLNRDEIVQAALWCAEKGYGSLVLQSGERNDDKFVDFVASIVREIKEKSVSETLPNGLGITLCVGEQNFESYKKLYNAGAHRYLLRIESSSKEIYERIHPKDMSFEKRKECLFMLRDVGFNVGTGVMIGLPGQTLEDLANDILFFKEIDADMIGMGPFIVHEETPYSEYHDEYADKKQDIYRLALRMIAATRIYLKDINIASTTALQAMYPMGREMGLLHGANIIMPLLTPTEVRESYQLYDGKPCLDEFSSECFDCIQNRIESTGRTVALNEWGDSIHFKRKNNRVI